MNLFYKGSKFTKKKFFCWWGVGGGGGASVSELF